MLGAAFAHEGLVRSPQLTVATAWTVDPLALLPLALAAWLYWRGSLRAGPRQACFAAGMAAIFLALVWPLDALGERLFSAHMAQHLVLMNLAAPLLVLGAPVPAMLRALPRDMRSALARLGAGRRWRAGWQVLSHVACATVLQQAMLWTWHMPPAIAAALESDVLHIAMHASLLAAALVFWTAILRPSSGGTWGSIAALLFTLKISGLACIALLVREGTLYPVYGDSAAAWGLSPTEDEQLGWGLMMAMGAATYLAAALALSARALVSLERAHAGPRPTASTATSATCGGAAPTFRRTGGSR
ncbi:MAG TPA: cytochrome c oxidase assembly protein [Burkholderiales bacterium]|nr:cytochrome c oxidase assembly protein [Burkholderiales bacterium]